MSVRTLVALLIALSALPSSAWAGSPPRLPVYGTLTDAAGTPLDSDVEVLFTLYTDAAGSAEAWSETVTVAVDRGAFVAQLGSGVPLDLALFRDYDEVFLGITVSGDPQMELIPLASVPFAGYAAYCGEASSIDGMDSDQLYANFATRIGDTAHGRYEDTEAVSAMGAVSDANPLNHNRFTASEAVSAMGAAADTNSLNHSRYTDAEAIAAVNGATTLDVTGDVTLAGGNLTGADTITATGDITARNTRPLAEQMVHRRVLFGYAGDTPLLHTADATASNWTTIHGHYGPFGYARPNAQPGAERRYRLYAIYSDNMTTATGGSVEVRFTHTGGIDVETFTLPRTWGGIVAENRDAYSDWFIGNPPTSHATSAIRATAASRSVVLHYLELQTWDFYP